MHLINTLSYPFFQSGGGIVNQLKKSYSLSDLSDPINDGSDEIDDVLVTDPRLVRRYVELFFKIINIYVNSKLIIVNSRPKIKKVC